MKRLDRKVSIYDTDTLEPIGDYKEGQVGIMKENEMVLDFHTYWPTWLIFISLVIGLCIVSWKVSDEYCEALHKINQLEAENTQLKSHIAVTEHELNVEILAGKYATLRTPAPTNMNEVYKMCIQSGAWYPEIIMAQYIIESGSGTSQVASNARNFYGMKYIGTKGRPTLQIPHMNVSGYGMYLNWQHSVLDRVLWDDYVFNKTKPTREQYLVKIGNIYAEDPNYICKVLSIANEWAAKTDSIRMVVNQDSLLIQ